MSEINFFFPFFLNKEIFCHQNFYQNRISKTSLKEYLLENLGNVLQITLLYNNPDIKNEESCEFGISEIRAGKLKSRTEYCYSYTFRNILYIR